MSDYRAMQREVSAWWKTLTPEQKANAPETVRRALSGDATVELGPDELFDQAMEQGRTMISDAFTNMAYDMRYAVLERLQSQAAELEELRPELERLKGLAGEWNDPNDPSKQFFMENVIAFWQAAEKRRLSHDDVDPLMWSQARLNPDWELKDWYTQDDVIQYSGADIKAMLVKYGYAADIISIDESAMYKMDRSPGGGADVARSANWANAYYYKAIAEYAGKGAVAIADVGQGRKIIIGAEERVRTAGAQGIVAKFLRPYHVDPGDVLDREWNNSIIWPEPTEYTEIRFQ